MSTTTKKRKQQPAKSTNKKEGFTAEEKAAMRARARELKEKTDGESAVRAAIAAMSPKDRAIAKRLHELIKATAPDLSPKTWYGMPAYAKGGKVVCFFRNAGKFKERYAMLGFNDSAKLDNGSMWPVAFALTELTAADEAKIRKLVKRAVG
ncbi:MAG: iron chaperone [Gaiellaceae bacterium]